MRTSMADYVIAAESGELPKVAILPTIPSSQSKTTNSLTRDHKSSLLGIYCVMLMKKRLSFGMDFEKNFYQR